ncbi:MAG: B12-binding domain-containing protein, partial [Anaerolineales bacterium]
QGLIAAMDEVGDNFSKGKLFVPQMLRSAKAMQACMDILKSHFQEGEKTLAGPQGPGTGLNIKRRRKA